MEVIARLGTLLGLSFVSGINLYATVAVTGLCVKYQLVQGLAPELGVLANDAVIFVAFLLYAVEFLVDKVPGLDTLWDSIHTIIRPFGGALLALLQVGEASAAVEVIAFMVGASLASVSHITKAGTRVIINTSPEPFSNILVSLAEDVGAIGFAYLALAYPKLSLALTLLCLVLIALVLPLVFRTVRMFFAALGFKVKCLVSKEAAWVTSQVLPHRFETAFDQHKEPEERLLWTAPAYAVRVAGLSRFSRLQVVVSTRAVHLLYRQRLSIRDLVLPLSELREHKHYRGAFLAKWLLRSDRGTWLLNVYGSLTKTLPQQLAPRDSPDDKPF